MTEQELREFEEMADKGWFVFPEETKAWFLSKLKEHHTKVIEKVMEEIKKSFINKYQGAGEVFFPYESEGNCLKEEEISFIEQEWNEILNEADLKKQLQASIEKGGAV